MFRKFAPASISMPLKRFFAKYFDILVCLLSFGGLFKQTACFTIRILIELRLEYKSVFFFLKHHVSYLNFNNIILAFVHLMTDVNYSFIVVPPTKIPAWLKRGRQNPQSTSILPVIA